MVKIVGKYVCQNETRPGSRNSLPNYRTTIIDRCRVRAPFPPVQSSFHRRRCEKACLKQKKRSSRPAVARCTIVNCVLRRCVPQKFIGTKMRCVLHGNRGKAPASTILQPAVRCFYRLSLPASMKRVTFETICLICNCTRRNNRADTNDFCVLRSFALSKIVID